MENIIKVNEDAVEPNEYFKVLKENIKHTNADELKAKLDVIAEQIINAKEIGQTSLIDKLSFLYDVIAREQVLATHGIVDFAYQDDIKQYLDKTKHIRIIELERFPRTIPQECLSAIKAAKALELFDEFCVVFTDMTEEDYKTPEEKKFVERNRDPIVFGFFRMKNTGLKHERFYKITDWEDEHCDLTFDKMINKMAVAGINKNAAHTIGTDHTYIKELVRANLENLKTKNILSPGTIAIPMSQVEIKKEKTTYWDKFKKWSRLVK